MNQKRPKATHQGLPPLLYGSATRQRTYMLSLQTFFFVHRNAITIIVICLGIFLRILTALPGYSYDVESYKIVADIMAQGDNVYANTIRYNYGPPWANIIHIINTYIFPCDDMHCFHMKIAIFLTTIDTILFFFILKKYSIVAATFFFINPLSIYITGSHSQFDNLAVLVALLSVAVYNEDKSLGRLALCLGGLGLSLAIKHILFLFPFWMAAKERSLTRMVAAVAVPYSIFLASFIFSIPEGLPGIVQNVFLYRSYGNAPLWSLITPYFLFISTPKIVLFIGSMAILGYYIRNKTSLESINIYCISVVAFSSAIANQYLSIPVPAISTLMNLPYALYSLIGGWYLSMGNDTTSEKIFNALFRWNEFGPYNVLVLLLAIGLSQTLFRPAGSFFEVLHRTRTRFFPN